MPWDEYITCTNSTTYRPSKQEILFELPKGIVYGHFEFDIGIYC